MERSAVEGKDPNASLSPWWRNAVILVMISCFSILIWLTVKTYSDAPPVPERVVTEKGETLFTGDDIIAGQEVFLKYGLMENGTIWGHGAYLGPDFSAAYLHQLALDTKDPATLLENRYDGKTGMLRFTEPEVASYHRQVEQWKTYFAGSTASHGL